MNLKNFKLGVGPMSRDIIDICLEYSKFYEYPMMIIASRNQVDHATGYVCNTAELVNLIKNNINYEASRILVCRDHCGPYFSDLDVGLDLEQAVERCIKTIHADIQENFDLIHIDVSRTPANRQHEVAHKLFSQALSLNPNLLFEFGSEDNTGENLDKTLENLDKQIELISQYKHNMRFLVCQTGSLTKETQVGNFSLEANKAFAKKISSAGLLFKEHNADYLDEASVRLRKQVGVASLNIAPQLGSIQSSVITDLGSYFTSEYEQFYNFVLEKNYWKKWISNPYADDDVKFLASAHYFFNSTEYDQLMDKILGANLPFRNLLKEKLFTALDQYRKGLD